MGLSSGGTSIAATYGTTRSWDYYGSLGFPNRCVLKILNPSAGNYVWQPLDDLLSITGAGKQVIITLGQPADYLVSRAAIGGAYLGGKANMCPDDLTGWATAVTAVVSRAKNTWGRTGLVWELGNEIDGTSSYGDSLSLLGPYTRTTVQAILAVDPYAKIMAPSISNVTSSTTFNGWANASDGAGGTSKQWVTLGNYHAYENYALGSGDGQYNRNAIVTHWNNYQSLMSGVGVKWPVWITEAGYTIQEPQQAADHQAAMMIFAALGAQCYLGYNYDDVTNFGISGIAAKWNIAANLLQNGAVISSLAVGVNAIQVVINGTTYTF